MTAPLFVGDREGTVRVLRCDGRRWTVESLIGGASWPAPGRDGRLLVTHLDRTPEGPRACLEVVFPEGRRIEVPGTSRKTFIAPRLPMYASWSPAGDRLAFVASDGDTISLSVWEPDGEASQPRSLGSGIPLFHAWSPDGRLVALHAGQELSLVATEGEESTLIARDATGFRVPAFSHDGRLLAWARLSGSQVDVLVREDGRDRTVARFSGGVALAFRPGSHDLAVAVTRQPESGSFDSLHLVESALETADPPPVLRGPFVAFAWSPDGERIAVTVPAQTGDGRYAIHVVGRSGDVLAAAEALVPSIDTRLTLGFFDQYRLSQPWWSPDSKGLVVCGRLVTDSVPASFGDPLGAFAYWWPAERGASLGLVAPAEVACFPPPPPPAVNGR